MRAGPFRGLLTLALPLLMGAAATQPDALPSAESASQAAATLTDKPATLGPPKLYDHPQGLAVDRTDAKNPKVVAYVGATWLVPIKADGSAAPPPGYALDRGTGRPLARAHEVVPMPKPGVLYVDEWQIAAAALGPDDAVASGYGSGLSLRLDVGGGAVATMTIQPGMGRATALGANAVRIKFGSGSGKMVARAAGTTVNIQAISDDGAYLATLYAQKAAPKLEQRFKDILSGLAERAEVTRVWPADSRPRVTGVDGWTTAQMGNQDVAMWNPEVQTAAPRPGVSVVYTPVNMQVFVAARVLHPYDLPPAVLIDGLSDGKVLSSRPAELGEWVGIEKVIQFDGPTHGYPGQYGMLVVRPGVKVPTTTYQARVLDLHRDLRRLLIRCQAPKDQFDKHAADFDKVLKAMKVPPEPMEPVVVPLEPATFKPPKK